MDYQNEYPRLHRDLHDADSKDKIDAILDILPQDAKINSILDVACGSGKILIEVSKSTRSTRNVGIDMSKKIIDVAKGNNIEGISWIASDIFDFDQPKSDLVLAIDIVEHIQDDEKFLDKISKLGEYFVIKVPIEINLINRLVIFLSFGKIDPTKDTEIRYGHIHHYSIGKFREMIIKSGFTIEKINYMHLPKRSRYFWEILRLLFLPLWLLSKKNYVEFNGGFLVLLLS